MGDRRTAKPTSETELAALAEPSPSDVEGAVARWDQDCSPRFRGMLAADTDTKAADRMDKKLPTP